MQKEENNNIETSRPRLRTKTTSGSGILETVKPRLKKKISTSSSSLQLLSFIPLTSKL
jgi:hypothetical protein